MLKDKKGLTLVEVMVAVGILLSGLVGVLILIAYSFQAYREADNALIASHLAEEAIEVVIAIRNTNWQQGENWDTGLGATAAGIVDYNESESVRSGEFCMNYTGTYYVHGTTAPCNTPYTRHVEITYNTETLNGEQVTYMDVLAVVTWDTGTGRTPEVRTSHRLYDWR